MANKKIAVVLFNLGGPDSLSAVRPFLYNFFSDKNIIGLPTIPRKALAWLISATRCKKSSENYAQIGGKSPLLENTVAQQEALEKALSGAKQGFSFKCFTAMRYWHPLTNETVLEVQKYKPDEVILLPLYPQYSFATTKSSFEEWDKCTEHLFKDIPIHKITSYEDHPFFVKAQGELILTTAKDILMHEGVLLFSAHGIPESFVKNGDVYEEHIKKTVTATMLYVQESLKQKIEYNLCYQSKVGPAKWLKPYFADVLNLYKSKDLVVVPIAFVSEHVETLEELDVEYAKLALEKQIKSYTRVPTVGTNSFFISCLKELVLRNLSGK